MRSFRGYKGSEPVECLINTLAGRTAIILGNGKDVLSECESALKLIGAVEPGPVIFAVNDMGRFLPVLDQWVCLDTKFFEHGAKVPTHTACGPGANYDWRIEPEHFHLSGYFAMQVAMLMGCDRIILCGCPGNGNQRFDGTFNDTPHFAYGSGSTASDTFIRNQLESQMKSLPDFKKRVRSLSGWSQSFFGGLDKRWEQL